MLQIIMFQAQMFKRCRHGNECRRLQAIITKIERRERRQDVRRRDATCSHVVRCPQRLELIMAQIKCGESWKCQNACGDFGKRILG